MLQYIYIFEAFIFSGRICIVKLLQKRSEKLKLSMRICIAGTVLCLLAAPNVPAADLTVPETTQEQTEVTEQQPASEQQQPEKEEPAPVKKTTVKLKAPKMTKVDASYKKTITIRWKKVKNADGYFIYRKTGKCSYKKIATVKKGSTTSYGCIISAGSIVKGRFEQENCLLTGNPAKVVKSNIKISEDYIE